MYGVTGEGNSVLVHVHGFTPYFWAAPGPDLREEHLPAWQAALEGMLQGARSKSRVEQAVLAVQLVPDKQSLLGYHFGRKQSMLKVYVAMPQMIATARGVLEKGFGAPGIAMRSYMCFEAQLPFVLRFMVDRDIVGCNWLTAPAGSYSVRGEGGSSAAGAGAGSGSGSGGRLSSSVQLEVDVVYDSLESHAAEGTWQRIAPLRILSFDIECMGRKGCFPEADQDPVIQIANVVTVQGASSSIVRNVFTLGSCSPIVGAQVIACATEEEMLRAWARFVVAVDPDIVTGYNVQNFDIPYILNRCRKLKLEDAQVLGRIRTSKATMRDTTFSSSAHGKRENVETQIDGRVVFDMLQYIRREHKLSSYSLNSVSAHFLGQQKEDVHHSIIADLQRGSAEDRRRLAVYCLKDAFLPQRLCDKLMVMINHVEMSRVVGVPLDFLLSRGQQIKVVSMLLRKCKPLGFLMPTLPRSAGAGDDDVAFEGATVIEPMRGFYDEPIATLDFASLYPSIMQAHNLCYSTLLAGDDIKSMKPEDIERSPDEDFYFVRPSVHKGVLPQILDELLAARKRAKKDMAAATDPFVVAVQNGRQLALKISANSVYGFTGATVGMLPCLPISSSVTAYGRHMIADTKAAVETRFTVAGGYPANAIVVYGDTDSVMVKFGVKDVATAMALGAEAAKEVTKLFPAPVKLEFEKVYFPFLLMNKKRYAGLYWSKPEKWDKMDTKGIETVRRDNCALVRTVIDTCLRKILVERSVPGAIDYVKQVIADLLQNKLDISMLVITKALGKGAEAEDYKAKQAHVELAERMRKRDPGSAPAVGDRVPYVLIEGAKGAPAYERSEDPIYVLENNIPIDARYYLDNQLNGPLTRMFEPIIDNVGSLFTGDHTRTISVSGLRPLPFTLARARALSMLACSLCPALSLTHTLHCSRVLYLSLCRSPRPPRSLASWHLPPRPSSACPARPLCQLGR
jgi:DNA polymerase delta subunit 1